MSESLSFDLPFLQLVSDWMRDSPRERRKALADELKVKTASFPVELRSVGSPIYRQLTLDSRYLIDAGTRYRLEETTSCWTTSVDIAKALKGGVHPDTEFWMTVIFELPPDNLCVVLNLDALKQNQLFQKAVDEHCSNIHHFTKGLGRWTGSDEQHEIIVDLTEISLEAVFAFGGFYRRNDRLKALWANLGFNPEVADSLLAITGITPGDEKWVTDKESVNRLVSKWVAHAIKRAGKSKNTQKE